MGSTEATIRTLNSWFGNNAGLSKAYECFADSHGKWPWKPLISRSFILPKHRFTLWLMAHAKLLTRDRLSFVEDKSYVLCNEELESINHLFFQCKFSVALWKEIRNWLGMSKNMASPTAVLRVFRNCYRGNSVLSRMCITALAATVYNIWSARNRCIFDDDKPTIEDLVHRIKIFVIPTVVDVLSVVV
ncbi:uncharacterized protein LOC142504743 [Primulina tabacum]|uniref:uncharacterized protein LOC142504743 n=1 Tax=Primulina tabacum TaxID=48773 RepID=UPI003F59CD32